MTREEYEESEKAFVDGMFPRGLGDPDAYGYPGEPTKKESEEDELEDVPF